ncbi:hypothetical protein E4U60_006171 [Claviceps pazoutovae]|uniref:non-specific serine/threonine protein kinase n=1 Tax=Claviceps pazoutovae TaxID=1649127 RepID=A0A9P7MGR5_9HYPO|nr:hypothetical protein E4U60_006171 [Claviceps pazoutovae]
MASHGYQPAQAPGSRLGPHGGFAPHVMPSHGAPAGTFSSGTKIQVGSHRVVIQKYLSEGGFAHVYLVKLSSPIDGNDSAVLKRVAVPDKESLRGMRTEVETMKRLKGHRPIVTYIDSHASELKNGGYEVFLLMEFCDGGGLIDFMNTRLQHRLTEPEILHIFADVAEGVACMHYLKPPLLHRDLKVENVLIVGHGSSKRFKVCDFGSTAPPRPAPTTVVECRLMDEDIQKHTTLQYRAPEMVDVYRKQPLNEKSDIWALGVFLYKLCYYTTPFEDQGQLAIMNASFKYPHHPTFSDRLKKLIGSMLREDMQSRPNIYQVLLEACAMQGREVPIHDIYSGKAQRESYSTSTTSPPKAQQSKAGVIVGAVYSPPPDDKQSLPDIVPMRRGRPAISPGPPQKQDSSARKVTDGDPFAALDSANAQKMADADEISSRFPTLDQFALLHDKGTKFDFDASAKSPNTENMPIKKQQNKSERSADEAFAIASPMTSQTKPSPTVRPHSVTPVAHHAQNDPPPPIERSQSSKSPFSAPSQKEHVPSSRASVIIRSNPDLEAIAMSSQTAPKYVSTGTMTSDLSSRAPPPQADTRYGQTNLPKASSPKHASSGVLPVHVRPPHLRRPSLSSRPSREDNRRQAHAGDSTSSGTSTMRQRPASTGFDSSTLEFLRERELQKPHKSSTQPLPPASKMPGTNSSSRTTSSPQPKQMDDSPLLLDVTDEKALPRQKQVDLDRTLASGSPGPRKAAKKLSGVIHRFETGSPQEVTNVDVSLPQTHFTMGPAATESSARSDMRDVVTGQTSNVLVDIDDDDMTPEMRREVERKQLEEEEKRVAAAQAEYRNRIASPSSKPTPGPKNVGVPPRTASTIQSRMQSLLNEDQNKPTVVQRTAQGYGKYTDDSTSTPSSNAPPGLPRKPAESKPGPYNGLPYNGTQPTNTLPSHPVAPSAPSSTAKPAGSKAPPPAPKKKPTHLNNLSATGARPASPVKQSPATQPEQLIAMDLPHQPLIEMSAQEKADYIADFAKRFPSLGALEMEARRGAAQ